MNSAILLLTVAFPVSQGYKGAATTIRDLARHGLYSGHLGTTPSKREAVRLIVRANMERAEAFGQGAKARRRHGRAVMRSALAEAVSIRTSFTHL